MAEQYGAYWVNESVAYVIRSSAAARGLNQVLAMEVAGAESGWDPWAVGDCQSSNSRTVYGRTYYLPYFPQKGSYCSSFGLFQLNMAGGLGTDWYPRWWELLNIFTNCAIAADRMVIAQREADGQGLTGFAWLCYIVTHSGWPGLVPCSDYRVQRYWTYFLNLAFNPDGSWAVWPPLDPPGEPAPAQPSWVCQATPSVPPDYWGWCPGPQRCSLWMGVSPANSGTTAPPVGRSEFQCGSPVTLAATPNTGYAFDYWTGDAAGSDPVVTIILDRNKQCTARFKAAPQCALGISCNPTEGGTTNPVPGIYYFNCGTRCWVTAGPYDGWRFVRWEGDIYSPEKSIVFDLTVSKNIVAVFEKLPPPQCALGMSVSPPEGGTTSPEPGIHYYDCGVTAWVAAAANEGWVFDHWGGDKWSPEYTFTFPLTMSTNLIAFFRSLVPPPVPPKPLPVPEKPQTLAGVKMVLAYQQLPTSRYFGQVKSALRGIQAFSSRYLGQIKAELRQRYG